MNEETPFSEARPSSTGTYDVEEAKEAEHLRQFIPNHHLIRRVGRGSYGEVWLSRNVLGTYRAVKIVRREEGKDRSFEREFRGLQHFEKVTASHPGLVLLLDVGINAEEKLFYYAMELADDVASGQKIDPEAYIARTLRNEVKTRGRLPLAESIEIGLALASALAHLESHGLAHRDVKPSNIIFVKGLPKLGDIGLVTRLGEPATGVCTITYTPPEGPGGRSVDLYGLGRVLYEISTGNSQNAFPELPVDMLEGNDACRLLFLNRIILKACAFDPAQRYASVSEMEADLRRLLQDVENPGSSNDPSQSEVREDESLEATGGAMSLVCPYYVERPADREFSQALDRRDSIVLIKGGRQIGKTSLLARGLQHARKSEMRVLVTDFQKLDAEHLKSVESLFTKLGDSLADQLDLEVLPSDVWDARRSPNANFERYLRREVVGKMTGHLVWGMDEVDRLFGHSYCGDVFGLFRSWHNERALNPSCPWSRLTLAISYATEAHLFITDINQSPFNVGTRLRLEDFTLEQVQDLNRRYRCPLPLPEQTRILHELLGGQPYLVRHALQELAVGRIRFEELVAHADDEEGIFGDHLRRIQVLLSRDESLRDAVRLILRGGGCRDANNFYRLRSAGLMTGDSPDQVRPRCQIYATYLQRNLL